MAITSQRYIAFIDILGFKDLVGRNSHDLVLKKLETISELIQHIKKVNQETIAKEVYAGEELMPFIFSDSIAIFTKGNTVQSLKFLLYACQFLFTRTITIKIPIKGALAFGTITIDLEKSIFFGQPIIDAFLLQEELKYYGLILHHSVENHLSNSKFNISELSLQIIKSKTPTRSGNINYYNLKYSVEIGNTPEMDDENKILESLYNSVSGSPRVYVDNTLEMYSKIKRINQKK